ncbi:hypothetical protein HOG48_05860 [Candidatus Peregrinibacteria bacterium]|jgi:hypothetical protein|nr:hypothetical protein [Candidatus Peregrinibacteria bacterium]
MAKKKKKISVFKSLSGFLWSHKVFSLTLLMWIGFGLMFLLVHLFELEILSREVVKAYTCLYLIYGLFFTFLLLVLAFISFIISFFKSEKRWKNVGIAFGILLFVMFFLCVIGFVFGISEPERSCFDSQEVALVVD